MEKKKALKLSSIKSRMDDIKKLFPFEDNADYLYIIIGAVFVFLGIATSISLIDVLKYYGFYSFFMQRYFMMPTWLFAILSLTTGISMIATYLKKKK